MSQNKPPKQFTFSFIHKCDLHVAENEDLLPVPSPYDHACNRFIYYFRTVFSIHKNYESRRIFRSHASFFREKVRHLTTKQYRYTIHPLSNFAIKYHLMMAFVWLIAFTVPPVFGSYLAKYLFDKQVFTNDRLPYFLFLLIFNFVMLIDVVIRFKLGYIINKTREIVLEPKRVAKHYLKTFFLFDCIPVILAWGISIFPEIPYIPKLFMYQFYILRYVRIRWMMDGVKIMFRKCGLSKLVSSVLVIYLYWLIFIHWWTCTLKFLNVIRDEYKVPYNDSWISDLNLHRARISVVDVNGEIQMKDIENHVEYFHYFSIIICHFLGAGVGNFRTHNSVDMIFFSILLMTSLMIYLVSLALLLQSFDLVNLSEGRFDEILAHAEEYMVTKKFPALLRERIMQYYDYKFDKKFFSERQILSTLSEHLQMEILLYSCRHLIDKVHLFKGLSKSAVGCILALLKQEIYLSNDVIMRADDEDGTLYFILYGTCAVTLLSGKEAMHIEDGNHFGENRYFAKKVPQDFLYMIVALEPCEIYSLSKTDIYYCCKHYPEVSSKIDAMLVNTSKHYNHVLAKVGADDDMISATDILEQLRRGNILNHGRRRRAPLDAFEHV